ncbi:MAG: hypothetical protein QOG00_750 [Pyrinomonadaceae bacterium]|nr:hypothetical protein [Pyrinomonadaceae bacterium]MDX6269694.1 hypothetical protein [Acidobacteriota bacterium]
MSSEVIASPFVLAFTGDGAETRLELMNASDQPLRCVEILTVFLKDEETSGAPSRAHIRFEAVKYIQAREKAVMPHKTLIDGKPADPTDDQLERLKVIAGAIRPYVLDISWEDPEGKSRFQRIPVGH